jgi:hypothetical protein
VAARLGRWIGLGGALLLGLSACGGGGSGSSPPHVNQTPTAANDILRADGAALSSIDVLQNDTDPDGDALTVSIIGQPLIGTATVNADQSVSLSGLPSDFKGLTTFSYRVTDPSGASADAAAAVFVGTDPFRVAFVGDAVGDGSNELYLNDFAAAPVVLTAATQGGASLKGFAISQNGETVVYRSQDSSGASALFLVQTAKPKQAMSINLPAGLSPVQDAQGRDQFTVSPDGQWIALIAGSGGGSGVYVLAVSSPATLTPLAPSGAMFASSVTFSPDSKNVYFLASDVTSGANRSLYFASLSAPANIALVSAQSVAGTNDDVLAYTVAQNQSRIAIEANRLGRLGVFYIDPAHLTTEVQVSHTFASGEVLYSSTVGIPASIGGGDGTRVAYTTQNLSSPATTRNTYVAEVSAAPNPRLVAAGAVVVGFRPDELALLFSSSGNIYENVIDSGTPSQLVSSGSAGWYDSTGNIVLLSQAMSLGGSPPAYYPILAVTERGSFGTQTQPVDDGSKAVDYLNVSGFDHAVAILAEGPTSGTAPKTATLSLVNALAPDVLLPLSGSMPFESPLQLTSDVAAVVGY